MIILCESLRERRMIIDLRRLETLYINDENLIGNTNIEHRQILTKIIRLFLYSREYRDTNILKVFWIFQQ